MGCNCKMTEAIVAIIVLVLALWPTLLGSANVSKWVIVVAAIVLLLHSFACKACAMDDEMGTRSAKKKL